MYIMETIIWYSQCFFLNRQVLNLLEKIKKKYFHLKMKIKLTMISTINYPQTDNYVAILLPSLACHLESLMKIYF